MPTLWERIQTGGNPYWRRIHLGWRPKGIYSPRLWGQFLTHWSRKMQGVLRDLDWGIILFAYIFKWTTQKTKSTKWPKGNWWTNVWQYWRMKLGTLDRRKRRRETNCEKNLEIICNKFYLTIYRPMKKTPLEKIKEERQESLKTFIWYVCNREEIKNNRPIKTEDDAKRFLTGEYWPEWDYENTCREIWYLAGLEQAINYIESKEKTIQEKPKNSFNS